MYVGLVEGFAVVSAFVGSPLGFKVVGFDVGVVLGDASAKFPPLRKSTRHARCSSIVCQNRHATRACGSTRTRGEND